MLSNYPPGVTGTEYEISGPDTETDDKNWECPGCTNTGGTTQTYGYSSWTVCHTCDETFDNPVPDNDDDEPGERVEDDEDWWAGE